QDNKRFEKHAETMQDLLERGNAVAILAHQGRPGRDTYVSLKQHAEILSSYLDREVEHVDETVGEEALEAVEDLEKGEVLMLENVRFLDEELENLPPEEHAESELVETLSPHFDVYVNDAFSAAHRSHASLVGFPPVMDSYAGPVMEEEWENNTALRNGLDGKVTMLVGGKKAGDVVRVMEDMAEEVDDFLVAGLIGELFLRAEGYDVGFDVRSEDDLMHELWMDNRDAVKRLLDENGEKIHLPEDLAFHNGGMMREEVLVEEAAKQKPYWDIGRRTVEKFRPYLEDADAVFVKGAPGVFEDEKFRYGTAELLETLASRRSFTVVGGGDTARAVDLCGLEDSDFDHVSIAGGAYIRALTGEELPAIETLKNHPNK
ncbi:MAG: phosphoglycerate kinase, partial [Candidatus Nanohaloarchaea archaeon]